MKKLLLALLLVSSFSALAQSLNDVYLGAPAIGGTGCPNGTASAVLSPDKKALSVIFDSYVAEAYGSKRIDRKTCNLAIPVHVPQGYSVSIFKVDYRGFAAIPSGGNGRFNVEYFFAGQQGPRVQKTFPGNYNSDFFLTNTLVASAVVWSKCGEDVNLRINSGLTMQTNSAGDSTYGSVDSVDVNSGMLYHFQWRRCN